jgi:hypothetical protein
MQFIPIMTFNPTTKTNKSSQYAWLIGVSQMKSFPDITLASVKAFLDEKRSNDLSVSARMSMIKVRQVY